MTGKEAFILPLIGCHPYPNNQSALSCPAARKSQCLRQEPRSACEFKAKVGTVGRQLIGAGQGHASQTARTLLASCPPNPMHLATLG